MKLYTTHRSPYVRVVRMGIEELGLAEHVEVIPVTTRVPDCPVNRLVPTGKVPTLVTEDGHALSESRLICQYLQHLGDGRQLVDPDPPPAERVLEGVVTGFIDGVSVWGRELNRPPSERSPAILEQERARAERCVDWLEARADTLGDAVDYPRLCLAAALSSLDRRVAGGDWRGRAPRLAAWYERFGQRASFAATRPPD